MHLLQVQHDVNGPVMIAQSASRATTAPIGWAPGVGVGGSGLCRGLALSDCRPLRKLKSDVSCGARQVRLTDLRSLRCSHVREFAVDWPCCGFDAVHVGEVTFTFA